MNGNYPAKFRVRLIHALALAVWLSGPSAFADDAGLAQQLRVQQQQSRFQLMLEQVRERARRRFEAGHAAAGAGVSRAAERDLGDRTESVRLESMVVIDTVEQGADEVAHRRLLAQQDFERDQQRIVHLRQDRRVPVVGPRMAGSPGIDAYATKRRERTRYETQSERQSLQRKLRR